MGVCTGQLGTLIPYRNNCAKYYDCTSGSQVQTKECTYPDLFSEVTLTCQEFTSVQCGIRNEPKAPCTYKVNCANCTC